MPRQPLHMRMIGVDAKTLLTEVRVHPQLGSETRCPLPGEAMRSTAPTNRSGRLPSFMTMFMTMNLKATNMALRAAPHSTAHCTGRAGARTLLCQAACALGTLPLVKVTRATLRCKRESALGMALSVAELSAQRSHQRRHGSRHRPACSLHGGST